MDGRPRPTLPLLSSPVLSCLGGMDGWICLLPLKSTQTPLSLSVCLVPFLLLRFLLVAKRRLVGWLCLFVLFCFTFRQLLCLTCFALSGLSLSLSLASVKPHNNNNNTPPQQQQRDDRAIGRTVDMTNHTDAPRTNRNVEQAQTKRKKFGFQTPNANHKSVPHRTILYKSIQFRILYSIRWTLVSTVHENHEAIEAVAI